MEKVHNLNEAMEWFLSNSDGVVICVKDGEEIIVNNYKAAKAFFEK